MRRFVIILLALLLVCRCKNTHQYPLENEYALPTTTACTDSNTPSVVPAASITDTIGGPWERPMTLESGTSDDALDCACTNAKPNYRNSTSLEAFTNLMSAVQGVSANATPTPDTVVIVGHGSSGYLCTGEGQDCTDGDGDLIRTDTHQNWEGLGQKLHNLGLKHLRIIGCGVGAGDSGAALLKYLAAATGLTVLAPNSLVSCSSRLELVKGGSWREAIPGSDVVSGAAVPSVIFTPPTYLKLDVGGAFANIRLTDITINRVEIIDLSDRLKTKRAFSAGPADVDILNAADLEHPLPSVEMLGLATGTIEMSIRLDGVKQIRPFAIYSNLALQDKQHPKTFYPVANDFTQQIIARFR